SYSADERRMMRAAARHHLPRVVAALVVAVGVAMGVLNYAAAVVRDREQAAAALARALREDLRNLPGLLPELDAHRTVLRASLERLEQDQSAPQKDREVAQVPLYRDRPTEGRAAALRARLLAAGPDEVNVIRDALAMHPERAGISVLHRVLLDESAEPGARLRVASALAAIGPG